MINLDGFDSFDKKSERTRNADRPEEDDDKMKTIPRSSDCSFYND